MLASDALRLNVRMTILNQQIIKPLQDKYKDLESVWGKQSSKQFWDYFSKWFDNFIENSHLNHQEYIFKLQGL